MRCSCGKQGSIQVRRRALPYCPDCFSSMLAREVRREIGTQSFSLQARTGFYADAAKQLLTLARREFTEKPDGKIPGCQETQAAAVIRYAFGEDATLEHHFPASITREELQRFMRLEPPAEDSIGVELATLEAQYPGTVASIAKHARQEQVSPR